MDRWIAVRSRLPRLHPLLVDGLVALVAAGLALAQLQEQPNPRDRGTLNIAFVLLQTLPLVVRRRFPFTVFAVGAGSMAVQGALGFYSPTFAFLALNVALYSLAAYGDRQLAMLGVMVWAGLLSVHLTFFVATSWPTSRSPTCMTCSTTGCCWPPLGSSARASGSGAPMPPSWRIGPCGWSANGRSRPGRRRSRNACGSPASCTTWWPTA